MTDKEKTRFCYYVATAIVVLLLILIAYMWHEYAVKNTGEALHARVPDNPANPQWYEYGDYLEKRAAQGYGPHGDRRRDYDRGHSHCPVDTNDFTGYQSYPEQEGMMSTYHWDQDGTYGYTPETWGIPPYGGLQPDYSGYSKDSMSGSKDSMMSTYHWDQDGTYGYTPETWGIPPYGGLQPDYSGYSKDSMSSSKDPMMNTFHWDQDGTYQHTAATWGLPPGNARPNYSGYSKENMGVGAHWVQDGTYGHSGMTLPAYGDSGYYEDVPTAPWA